jgi:hypothetical protein
MGKTLSQDNGNGVMALLCGLAGARGCSCEDQAFLLNESRGPPLSKNAEKSSRNDVRSITFQRFLNGRKSSSVYRNVTIPTPSNVSMCAENAARMSTTCSNEHSNKER